MTETVLSNEVKIRGANAADVPQITRIYNEGIRDGLATLETEERTPQERLAWLEARDERHPVLVAERHGAVAGWVRSMSSTRGQPTRTSATSPSMSARNRVAPASAGRC
jgi:L-amino acid N-acyltransferase YncA